MVKTPDEIKKGLEYCSGKGSCSICPYNTPKQYSGKCVREAMGDCHAYIQQLEAELADAKRNHQHTIDIAEKQKEQIDKLKKVVVRLNKERNAAVEALRGKCWACKKGEPLRPGSTARICSLFDMNKRPCPHWEWLGVKEE